MLEGLVGGLTDIIYPSKCPACKTKIVGQWHDHFLCGHCRSKIKKNLPPFCHSCGRRLSKSGFAKNICPSCQKTRMHFDRAFSPFAYDGPIKEVIHEFKYRGKDYLGKPLSRMMIDFVREYNIGAHLMDSVVAVPLSAARLREREFNQAHILAVHIGQAFNKEVLSDVLCRSRHTRTQTELEPDERLANVKDSFLVASPAAVKGKNLILVDDVLTTGATSSEAARALKSAGANIVFVLTLAN